MSGAWRVGRVRERLTEGFGEWIASLGFCFSQTAFQVSDFGFYVIFDGVVG